MRRPTAKISYAGCLGLSLVVSARIYSLNMRRSVKSQIKLLKTLYFRFQGRSNQMLKSMFNADNFCVQVDFVYLQCFGAAHS